MTFHQIPPAPARIERAIAMRSVAEEAARYAGQDSVLAEAAIDALAAEAIRGWRLDEATYWQRVKFHARRLRAAARSADDGAGA